MRLLLISALLVFSMLNFGTVATARYRAWKWQRPITPVDTNSSAEQCVVLDASLYAGAAPGLRDVLLVQEGREIPYALEESYDDDHLQNVAAAHGQADRSIYTTVLQIPLIDAPPRLDRTRAPLESSREQGSAVLLRRVPVERIELIPDAAEVSPGTPGGVRLSAKLHLLLLATPDAGDVLLSPRQSVTAERIEDELDINRPVERTAIGANLQRAALVTVTVEPHGKHFAMVRLQMHQRSLCYQPLTAAPLVLFYGNVSARAPHYDYAAHYQPTASPLLAHMGPATLNPGYRAPVEHVFNLTRLQRLCVAACVAAAGFLLTAVSFLRSR